MSEQLRSPLPLLRGVAAGIMPQSCDEPATASHPVQPSQGNIVSMLTRMPEPIKCHLRRIFVKLVDAGARLPGMQHAAAQAHRLCPNVYHWFAEHYEAYLVSPPDHRRGSGWSFIRRQLVTDRPSAPLQPPEDLSAEERGCYMRLAFATSTRRKRLSW